MDCVSSLSSSNCAFRDNKKLRTWIKDTIANSEHESESQWCELRELNRNGRGQLISQQVFLCVYCCSSESANKELDKEIDSTVGYSYSWYSEAQLSSKSPHLTSTISWILYLSQIPMVLLCSMFNYCWLWIMSSLQKLQKGEKPYKIVKARPKKVCQNINILIWKFCCSGNTTLYPLVTMPTRLASRHVFGLHCFLDNVLSSLYSYAYH